jgi:hypothetical protein
MADITKNEVVSFLTSKGYSKDLAENLWGLGEKKTRGRFGLRAWEIWAQSAQTLLDAGVTDLSPYDEDFPGLMAAAKQFTTKTRTSTLAQLGVTEDDVVKASTMGIDLVAGGAGAVSAYQAKLNQQALTTSNANLLTSLKASGGYTDSQLDILQELMDEQGMDLSEALAGMQAISGAGGGDVWQKQYQLSTMPPFYWANQWAMQNPTQAAAGQGAPAPGWLSQIVPGLGTGSSIGAQGAGTLAGMPRVLATQDWANMPATQKEGVGGYLNWIYSNPEALGNYATAVQRRAAPGGAPTVSPKWGSTSWGL